MVCVKPYCFITIAIPGDHALLVVDSGSMLPESYATAPQDAFHTQKKKNFIDFLTLLKFDFSNKSKHCTKLNHFALLTM